MVFEGQSVSVGNQNLFVPHASGVFAAPSMILHYIDAHEYAHVTILTDEQRSALVADLD